MHAALGMAASSCSARAAESSGELAQRLLVACLVCLGTNKPSRMHACRTSFGPLRAGRLLQRSAAAPPMIRHLSAMGPATFREPLLYTPGPLTTSLAVKQTMLRDIGSRDPDMIRIVQEIRDGLLKLGGVSQESGWECVLMQGSGTFAVEGIVSSVVPPPVRFHSIISFRLTPLISFFFGLISHEPSRLISAGQNGCKQEAGGKILVVSNGAYGKRMADMCHIHGIDYGEKAHAISVTM